MTTKSTNKILFAIFAIIISIFTPMSSQAFAASNIDACSALDSGSIAREAAGCDGGSDQLPVTVINILNVVIGISSLVAVIFIIIGGFNYMTSSGDATKVKKAKDTILYACIGLVICVIAFAIVNWAIAATQNTTVQ